MKGNVDPVHDQGAFGAVTRARIMKSRAHLARLDYLRAVAAVASHGLAHSDIVSRVGIPPGEADTVLRDAAAVPSVPEGFHGADPCEITERFAAGTIDGDTAAAELAGWPYEVPIQNDSPVWATYEPVGLQELEYELSDGTLEKQDE